MSDTNGIDYGVFDRPEITRLLFYPRPERNSGLTGDDSVLLSIPVDTGVVIGGKFHAASLHAPNILFFHGNGEIVSDYDELGPLFTTRGINFIPVDYRGYGRSSGTPTVTSLMKDCHRVFGFIKSWLGDKGYTGPVIVMGRSLGSAPALELAGHYQDQMAGLIIESGFAYLEPLLALLGVNLAKLGISEDRAVQNLEKMKTFSKPTLIIHAQYDHIIPFAEGKALYEASPAKEKKFLCIAGANHNNILAAGMSEYMIAIEWLTSRIENMDE